MVFAAIMAAEERIRSRIHSFRAPIKNPRLLFLVQCTYFVAPVVLGGLFMQFIIPDPDEMRSKIKPPTPEEQEVINAHKRRMQEQMDAALAARRAASGSAQR